MKENNQFIKYLKESKFSIIIILGFILFAFGQRLLSNSFSIDVEHYIFNFGTDVNWNWWISLNRWGLVLVNIITQMNSLPIFATNYITIVIMIFYSIAFNYLFYLHIDDKYKTKFLKYQFIFPILFVTNPIFAEQYNFIHQNIGVALGILMIPCSLILQYNANQNENKIKQIVLSLFGLVLVVWSFAIYQSIILLYIVSVAACYLLDVLKYNDNRWKCLFKDIVYFILATIIYLGICKIVGNQSSYLQMAWKDCSIITCIKNIFYCIKDILLNNGIFYNIGYTLSIISSLIFGIYLIFKKKLNIGSVLALIAIITAPFYIMIITGVDQLKRTQFNYSFVIGFVLLMFIILLDKYEKIKVLKGIIIIVIFCISYIQAYTTSNLFYTADLVFEQDLEFADKLVSKIEEQDVYDKNQNYKLIFLGYNSCEAKNLYVKGEVIGSSFFDFDYENIWGVNQRANVFLNILGYKFIIPTEEEFISTKEYAITNNMKSWPDKDCIKIIEDKIIVRLSEEM